MHLFLLVVEESFSIDQDNIVDKMNQIPGRNTLNAISNKSKSDYELGRRTVNFLADKGIITHVIIETKQEQYVIA